MSVFRGLEGSGKELSLGERLSSFGAATEEVTTCCPRVRFSFRKRLLPLTLRTYAGLDCGKKVGRELAQAVNDAIAHDGGGFGWVREQDEGDLMSFFRGVSKGGDGEEESQSPRSVLVVASEAHLWRTDSLDDGAFSEIAGRTANRLDEADGGADKEETIAFG